MCAVRAPVAPNRSRRATRAKCSSELPRGATRALLRRARRMLPSLLTRSAADTNACGRRTLSERERDPTGHAGEVHREVLQICLDFVDGLSHPGSFAREPNRGSLRFHGCTAWLLDEVSNNARITRGKDTVQHNFRLHRGRKTRFSNRSLLRPHRTPTHSAREQPTRCAPLCFDRGNS